MMIKKVREGRIPFAILILMLAFIFHSFPRYGVMFPSSVYALIVVILAFYLFCKIVPQERKVLLCLFSVFILEIVINSFIKSFNIVLQDISNLLQNMIPAMMAMLLVRKRCFNSAKIILGFYLLRILITMVTTIIGLQIFPGASRDLGNGEFVAKSPLYPVYLSLNIGGFDFVYTIVLLIPIVCYLLRYSSEFKKATTLKLIAALLLVFCMYCILKMEYTTALLFSVLASTSLFATIKTNIRKYLIFVFAIGVFFYLSKGILAQGLEYMSTMVESDEIAVRLSDMANSILGQATSEVSDVDARQDVYATSLNAIESNPLGAWFTSSKIGGGHSFILDYIAKYGPIGLILIICMLRIVYKEFLKPYSGKEIYPFLVLEYFLFIATAVMNPHLYLDYMAFVIPLFFYVSNNYKKSKNALSL